MITARKRRLGKVMFLHMSVSLSVYGGRAWRGMCGKGGGMHDKWGGMRARETATEAGILLEYILV